MTEQTILFIALVMFFVALFIGGELIAMFFCWWEDRLFRRK